MNKEEMRDKISTWQDTFRQGANCKAAYFQVDYKAKIPFKLGYLLWGLDIWVGKVPMIKLMIGANIINMVIMWLAR